MKKIKLLSRLLVLIGVLIMNVSQVWGAYNTNWQGKVYFRVPDSWTISTYDHIQVAVARSKDTNTDTYQAYFGQMEQISNTSLFYLSINNNHSSWNQNEYIFFSANDHNYGDGTFKVNGNIYYTTPNDYGCNNSSNYYFFNPTSDTNGTSVDPDWNSSRDVFFKLTNTIAVKVKMAGSGSYATPSSTSEMPATSVGVTAYYLNGDNSSTSNSASLSGSTYSANFYGCPGGKITLTQTAKTGFQFDGFYVSSSEITSPYYPTSGSAITIEARYSEKTYTVSFANDGNGSTEPSSDQTVGQLTGIDIDADEDDGYEFASWTITNGTGTFTGGGTSTTTAATTFYPTSTSTIRANFRSNRALTVVGATHVLTVTGSVDPVTLDDESYEISATSFETGYEFNNWTASPAANATFDNNKSATTNVTVHNGSVTVTANAKEILHTISLIRATSASVPVGCSTPVSITAATLWGATFDHWEATDGITITDDESSITTITATKAGTVTAFYNQSLYAYVVGRFKSYSKDRQSSYYTGNWNTTATNNEFEYDVVNDRFVLHTYAKPSELSANIDSEGQYFEIKTTEDEGDLEDASVEYFGKTSNVDLSSPGYEDHKIEMEKSKATGHPKFNSSTSDKYVVLYFKKVSSTYYLWYEEETIPAAIDEVNLSASRVPPTAPITATPTMYDIAGVGTKAYCWGVYTDEDCTSKVNSVSFTSLGDGKVQFMAPQEQGTYYLKLTVHSSDDCNAAIEDEEVVSFTVTTSQMVFFKNVPGWGNVHFYFLGGAYWDNDKGSGCAGRDGGAARGMTRIGNSDIYYYDYSSNSVMNTYMGSNSTAYIAFTDNYKPNANNFSGCQAAYRGDFSACATMYVPENYITDYKNTSAGDGQAAYYNRGYWTNYMSANSGFSLYIWDQTTSGSGNEVTHHEMTGTIGNNSYTFTYNFANDPNNHSMPYIYGFKAVGCGGSYYGAGSTMDMTDCTDWNLGTGTNNCGLKVAAKLEHKFILTLAGDGHVQVSVEYPVNVGDYRLLYDDNTQHPHPSQYIRKRANGKDTVAMFIRPSETENLKVQYCTGIDGETITWEDYEWNSGSAAIDVSGKADGVYVFYLEQDGSGNFNNVSAIKPYSGKYYIRTSCLDGGWNSYKTSSDNLMTYAQYPEDKGYGFNYYKAKWVGSIGTDVTYTIACDYSPSLCDTLTADPSNNPLSASEAASLPHTANIRFGWHSKTNNLKREYINGSSDISDRYLVMIGDEKLMDKDGNPLDISGLNENEISFTDINNWIYRCDVKAEEGAAVKLTANYDSHVQYFIGDEDETEEIIGSTESLEPKSYVMRVTYDFKTNRLMTAWLPSGSEIDADVELNADMMLIREGQNAATQVYFNSSGKSISDIHTIYGVMEFQYSHMAGKFPNWSAEGAYEYLMYYISFPFDVKVSEIFGCGVRGENWIIQKYNGQRRADIGWFKGDGTTTFWETMDGSETMKAYEGYLLLLDRVTFNDPSSSLWYKQSDGNSIYLYFPSTSVASGTISENDKIIHVPEHTCTINRPFTVDGVAGTLNHMNTDSHWNIMGTPLFETKTASTIGTPSADGAGATTLQYYYGWNKEDNTLAVRDALSTSTVFKSMHSYMVQYAGDVTFHGAQLTPPPASVAARRVQSDKNYRIELQMVNMNGKSSETFVELRENACDTFALNEDLYMVRSSKMADLYTFAGAYDVAANVLSVNNHVVPIGMDVKQAGTYRFTMPSDFSGTVTLIDTHTGTRTNLALGDYEVNLEKETLNNRFLLEIDINKMPTAIDGVTGGSLKDGKAHKFIENGVMYILQNGAIFDARGNRVK